MYGVDKKIKDLILLMYMHVILLPSSQTSSVQSTLGKLPCSHTTMAALACFGLVRSKDLRQIFLKELGPHKKEMDKCREALQKAIAAVKAGKVMGLQLLEICS